MTCQRTERQEHHVINVQFELADDLPIDRDIDIQEGRGSVVFRIGEHLTPEQIIAALNEGTAAILAGGHWFQEWHGDIIRAIDPDGPGGESDTPEDLAS
jgi:hypothetical protein